MTDEEKYKDIIYRLEVISNKISDLNNKIDKLKDYNDSYMIIDGNGYKNNYLVDVKTKASSSQSTIKNSIIPSLKSKINSKK